MFKITTTSIRISSGLLLKAQTPFHDHSLPRCDCLRACEFPESRSLWDGTSINSAAAAILCGSRCCNAGSLECNRSYPLLGLCGQFNAVVGSQSTIHPD